MSNARNPRLNQIIVTGRLTRDPEAKQGRSGDNYCKFGLAVDGWGGKDAPPTFYNVTVFGKQADRALSLAKGDLVVVSGRHDGSKYAKQDGSQGQRNDITAQFVEPLAWPDDGPQAPRQAAPAPGAQAYQPPEDDIPF